MNRFIISAILILLCNAAIGQEDLAVVKEQQIEEMRVDRYYNQKYQSQLRKLRRTYPMALKAKELIDQYEIDLTTLNKKRKKKKYSKKAHKTLKDEFTYNICDLYSGEGDLLMKLVHRETGMTVNEIIKNYRGGFQSTVYGGVAFLWGQDLNAEFDPNGEDWITEIVIQDIIAENVSFDKNMRIMDRSAYKDSMKEYRKNKKDSRKKRRKNKREQK